LKNAILWNVTLCGSCKNCHSEDITIIIRMTRISELHSISSLQLLVAANIVPSSLILSIRMMEAIRSSETSVLAKLDGVTSHKMAFFIVTAMKTLHN
jgi:hypothetical protein